jgi:hypothetical protein
MKSSCGWLSKWSLSGSIGIRDITAQLNALGFWHNLALTILWSMRCVIDGSWKQQTGKCEEQTGGFARCKHYEWRLSLQRNNSSASGIAASEQQSLLNSAGTFLPFKIRI